MGSCNTAEDERRRKYDAHGIFLSRGHRHAYHARLSRIVISYRSVDWPSGTHRVGPELCAAWRKNPGEGMLVIPLLYVREKCTTSCNGTALPPARCAQYEYYDHGVAHNGTVYDTVSAHSPGVARIWLG